MTWGWTGVTMCQRLAAGTSCPWRCGCPIPHRVAQHCNSPGRKEGLGEFSLGGGGGGFGCLMCCWLIIPACHERACLEGHVRCCPPFLPWGVIVLCHLVRDTAPMRSPDSTDMEAYRAETAALDMIHKGAAGLLHPGTKVT